MTLIPPNPKLYHITHVNNLAPIIASGGLKSDALIVRQGGPAAMIGMGKLKKRRLEELSIECLGGVMVGECVPFYFCPRSVMLYLIHMRNAEVDYQGGQDSIVHLQADLSEVLAWATANGRPWAFSLSNAAARYTEFRADPAQLSDIDWKAVNATDWRFVRERKQAEFLVKDTFPWELFRVVGVRTRPVLEQVTELLGQAQHQPVVEYRPGWYY